MATPTVLLLCDDLMFGSRIGATARARGAEVFTVKTTEAATAAAAVQSPTCVIADLAVADDQLGQLVHALDSLPHRPYIVAYGSHVDTARLQAAVDAGCDVVLPRSKFVEALENELPRWLAPRPE